MGMVEFEEANIVFGVELLNVWRGPKGRTCRWQRLFGSPALIDGAQKFPPTCPEIGYFIAVALVENDQLTNLFWGYSVFGQTHLQ